jgi:tetratricopeptide (TPR) repeat protein
METGDGDDSAGELTVKGLNAEKTGLWYQADRWYRQALQRDPDFGPAQLHMGILHLRGGRWRKAVGCLRRAVERDPDLPEANYYLGLAYAGMGEDGPAKDAFWAALRDQAGDACCLMELGRLSMRQKDFEEAAGHLSRALAAAPDETRAAGMLSASLRHMGRPEQALRTLEPMLFRFPADYLLRSEACLASVSLKMEPRARRESEAFLRLMDGRPESYLELAADYAGTGLFSEALTVIESGIAATSSRTYTYPMLCYHAGHCLERLGRTREAKNLYRRARRMRPDCCFPGRVESIAVLERVLDLFPDDANAAAYLGCILYHRTRRADATRLWQQAQRLTGDSVLLCTNLALASWDHDDFRGALYWLRRAMRIEPDNVKAVLWMDSVLAETGDGKKRLTLLEKACTKHPDDDDIREHCGSLLLDLGRPGKALDMILNHRFRTRHGVFNLTRLYLNARTALGEKAMAGGDYGRALDQFEKARSAPVSLGEDATSFRFFGKVHYLAGECLERLGRKAEARKSYRMCVAERRPRLPALSYYDYLSCMRLGKREAAQKALNRIRQTLEQIEAARDVKSGYRHYLRSLYLRALGRRRQAQEEAGRARLKGWRASDELRFGPGFGFA